MSLSETQRKKTAPMRRFLQSFAALAALSVGVSLPAAAFTPDMPDMLRDSGHELRREARQTIGRFKYRAKLEARGAYLDANSSTIAGDLDLLPDSIEQMDALIPLAQEMGDRFEIGAHLVLAVIHTESAFDPNAQSAANAYGLMQIVPIYAGRSATKFLTGVDRRPDAEQLFDAKLNVELGTAYLAILRERHYGRIKNPGVKNLAVLAAYNWGPTRVTRMLRAAGEVTSTEQFLALLDANAPQETIDYVARVTRRAKHYYAWLKHADKDHFSQPISSDRQLLADAEIRQEQSQDWKFPVAIR